MSSVQERLQMNRALLDKWTLREKFYLASAVVSSGDQNWTAVSRVMKQLCGSECDKRPSDWFSTKNCAVQYAHLLETVETPKRKKRSSESSSDDSPTTVETPADAILRRLYDERMKEIDAEILRDQQEYKKIHDEMLALESGTLTEAELIAMWEEMEKEEEAERIEEMRFENQMREREQRKLEMQRLWHATGASNAAQKANIEGSGDDMDIDDTITTAGTSSGDITPQLPPQTSTSPLLSSLLNSPTTTVAPSTSTTPNSARATAPTITTLLTSGSIPNSNLPAITLKSTIPPNEAVQLLTRPISGPPTDTLSTASSISAQNLLSPSQSAPTLSMLLEKNKSSPTVSNSSQVTSMPTTAQKLCTAGVSPKTAARPNNDYNNDEVPMDIEEDMGAKSGPAQADADVTDVDDIDPNEEQQLMEVLKTIGNLDDVEVLDIDVAAVIHNEDVDFLKGVDEASPSGAANDIEENNAVEEKIAKIDEKHKTENEETDEAVANKNEAAQPIETTVKEVPGEKPKVDTTSSDDSQDNMPLAAVASLEQKDRSQTEEGVEEHFLKENVESVLKNDEGEQSDEATAPVELREAVDNFSETKTPADEESELSVVAADSVIEESIETDGDVNTGDQQIPRPDSVVSEVITIPTDDESSNLATLAEPADVTVEEPTSDTADRDEEEEDADVKTEEKMAAELMASTNLDSTEEPTTEPEQETTTHETELNTLPPPPICIADTDEDSSTTDVSINASSSRRDDKITRPTKAPRRRQRKTSSHANLLGIAQIARFEAKTDEDTIRSSTPTRARPSVLRKLRDRDRSESPLIDDDITTTSGDQLISQRLRRRYSSTPVIDESIPNSPASSDRDDHDAKVNKKSLLKVYHNLHRHRNAEIFQRVVADAKYRYAEACQRQIDFKTIRKNIDSGAIRNFVELQRDVLLMCSNALMMCDSKSDNYKIIRAFVRDIHSVSQFEKPRPTSDSPELSEFDMPPAKGRSFRKSTRNS